MQSLWTRLVLVSALLVCLQWQSASGHGTVMDPVGRSSAWKKGFKTPVNYNDIELFCGGITVQNQRNGGKCGVCGDNWAIPQPRPNENGGKYGTGTIVAKYQAGQTFTTSLYLDANHVGYFEFSLCPLASASDLETEECFDAHPISLADGSKRYQLKRGLKGKIDIELRLPKGLTCQHCVFRWHWKTANNWGRCANGKEGMGCGPQETFRSCSDISIH